MPSARYSSGLTILPVWPICWLYGIQPEIDRGPGRADRATERVGELLDDPEAVRPADAAAAGDDDPRLLDRGGRARLADPVDDADRRGGLPSPVDGPRLDRARRAAPAPRSSTFGRTVTMPRPSVKPDVVRSLPPKTLISTAGPPSVQVTPVALTRTPSPVSADRAPARSRPSAPAPTRTTSGASASASPARCPAAHRRPGVIGGGRVVDRPARRGR